MTAARLVKLPEEREAHFQAEVLKLAKKWGWELRYHTHDSRRSDPGFPDLVLSRGTSIVTAELKSNSGKATPEQYAWLLAFERCTQITSRLWRPRDWADVVEVLRP